jgi:hypothetical protein
MRRALNTVLFFSLGLFVLTGCGSPLYIPPRNDGSDGLGPKPPAGQAQITSVSPSTVVAATASFTITVTGLNFTPTTSVLWDDNTTLPTTYVSPTVLKAQVPASLITSPTTTTIVPSPLLALNFGANFTITAPSLSGNNTFSVSKVPVEANDIAWDQVHQQFYLSVASRNGSNANTITALNPQTGALGSSISTGSEPDVLAVSSDAAYIYAGLNGAGSVRRYTLPALQSDINIQLGTNTSGPYYAVDIQPEPGSSHSVAISRGVAAISPHEVGGILIYDDAVSRPQSVPAFNAGPGPIDSLVWNPNGQSLYGCDNEIGSLFYIMSVNPTGVQIQTQTTPAGSSFGNHLHFDSTTSYIYSDTGTVIVPATGAVAASFPLHALQGGFIGNPLMVPDSNLNIAYFLGQTFNALPTGNYIGSGNFVIEAFDLTHFTFLGAIPITNVTGTPSRIIRWGSNGLAFLTTGTSGDGVYLVSGSFVTSPTM